LPVNALFVLNVLRDAPGSGILQLSAITNLSETMLKTVLDNAIETGIVEASGSSRRRRYKIPSELYINRKTTDNVRIKEVDEQRYSELVLSLASSQNYISRADVMHLLHITGSCAYRVLNKLVKNGRIVPVNKGRYAKYRLP
jgi:ATP-dependent DNA helicase RecG